MSFIQNKGNVCVCALPDKTKQNISKNGETEGSGRFGGTDKWLSRILDLENPTKSTRIISKPRYGMNFIWLSLTGGCWQWGIVEMIVNGGGTSLGPGSEWSEEKTVPEPGRMVLNG